MDQTFTSIVGIPTTLAVIGGVGGTESPLVTRGWVPAVMCFNIYTLAEKCEIYK